MPIPKFPEWERSYLVAKEMFPTVLVFLQTEKTNCPTAATSFFPSPSKSATIISLQY